MCPRSTNDREGAPQFGILNWGGTCDGKLNVKDPGVRDLLSAFVTRTLVNKNNENFFNEFKCRIFLFYDIKYVYVSNGFFYTRVLEITQRRGGKVTGHQYKCNVVFRKYPSTLSFSLCLTVIKCEQLLPFYTNKRLNIVQWLDTL